jgi:hypothetical protein
MGKIEFSLYNLKAVTKDGVNQKSNPSVTKRRGSPTL